MLVNMLMQALPTLEVHSWLGVVQTWFVLPSLFALLMAELVFAVLGKAYSGNGQPQPTPPLPYVRIVIAALILGLLLAIALVWIDLLPRSMSE